VKCTVAFCVLALVSVKLCGGGFMAGVKSGDANSLSQGPPSTVHFQLAAAPVKNMPPWSALSV